MPVNSQLTTAAIYDGLQILLDELAGEPADGAALIAALEAAETGAGKAKEKRHRQILSYLLDSTNAVSPGGYVHTPVITTAGTGYSVGDIIPIVGDGQGASVRVTTVGGSGEITGVVVDAGGYDFYETADSDSTGIGNEDGVIDVSIEYNAVAVVNDALANGDWSAV